MVSRRKVDLRDSVLSKQSLKEPTTSEMNSPRPTPVFFFKEQRFSTKKERQTPRENPPPTPRPRTSLKSCPPVSRLFTHVMNDRPKCISFRKQDSRLSSKYYNENSNKLYFNQCFDVICKIGSGSFGEVFKVRCKEDGKYYAVKRSKERFRGKSDRLRKLEEVKKHEQLPKHPNCVQFHKAWEERGHLYIQTELCETSLSQYSEENHDIPESTVWKYLVDLLLAVKHLHDNDLVHLDIKPENIFVTEDGICKLGDFGLVLDVSKENMNDALEGDPKYLAPELMRGIFTKAADIFSLGITVLELACDLDLPRGDTAWHQLRQREIPAEFIKRLSPSLAEVICEMMEPNYNIRPSVNDILQMPSVHKIYRSRMQGLRIQTLTSCLKRLCHFAVLFSCWIKSFLWKIFPLFKKEDESVTTPVRHEQKHPSDWDFSFSDEDVFIADRSFSDDPLRDVCTALFKDDVKPLNDSVDESVFSKSTLSCSNNNNQLLSTPPSVRRWDTKLPSGRDENSLIAMRFSPCVSSSPKSVRRSPRLAAKQDSSDSSPKTGIGPRNLLPEFEKEAERFTSLSS